MRDCNKCPGPGFDPTEQTGPVYLGGVLGIDVNGVRQPIDDEGVVTLQVDAQAAADSAAEALRWAQQSATNAQQARANAEITNTMVGLAKQAAADAEVSASDAEGSATDAAGSATQAAGYATAAAASAEAAQTAAERDVPAAAAAWLAEHVDPSTGYVLDNSLSVESAAADAKAAGTATAQAKFQAATGVYVDDTAVFTWKQGGVVVSTGAQNSVATRIRAMHAIGSLCRVSCDSDHKLWVYVYSQINFSTSSYLGRVSADGTLQKSGDPYPERDVWLGDIPKDLYIIIVASRNDNANILPGEDIGFKAWRNTDLSLDKSGIPADGAATGTALARYASWGQSNAIESAKHMLNIKWTPVAATMPNHDGFFEMTEQTGLPYSSVRDSDKTVGLNVSFKTFMTAVRDPRSVLYTRRSNSSNATTYYGAVCSSVLNYALRIGLNLTNYFLTESDLFETIPMQSIRPGDMLATDGHVAMVGDVTRDKWGRVTGVVVLEEWRPNGRTATYTSWAQFIAARSDYIARRYKAIDGVGYTAIPYVQCYDEQPTEITYPDIQTDHGDGAVFVAGETVTVHVIDPKSYTQIAVTKDGTSVLTRTSITDFTITNVQPGLYTITATGGGSESVSEFFVADVHGSFNASTGEVTFSSSNATPVLVNTYGWPVANNAIRCYPLPLTDDDRTRGSVNVSDLLTMYNPQAKVTFMTPYGTADWRSEYHQTWEAIT